MEKKIAIVKDTPYILVDTYLLTLLSFKRKKDKLNL